MVNHYSLVSSPGALHNQDVIIEHVRGRSPTILRVHPDQETVLGQVCSSILRMSQAERERGRRYEMYRIGTRPLTPACRSPRPVTGVQASAALTDAEMSRGAFHLASRKRGSNQRRAQLCFRFAHETGRCFGLNSSTRAHYG